MMALAFGVHALAGDFFFDADHASAEDIARAIGEYYGCSVLVGGNDNQRICTGRLLATNVQTAVEALAFMIGSHWRREGDKIFFVGGKSDAKVVKSYPSYGLGPSLGVLSRDSFGGVVGDRFVIEADETRASQVAQVMETVRERPWAEIELFVVDSSRDTAKRIGDWLSSARAGAGVIAQSALVASTSGIGFTAVNGFAPTYDVQIQGLFDLVRQNGDSKLESHETMQVLSGARSSFSSGQVLTDTSYTVVPNTAQQLQSVITRRTVGLTFDLTATRAGTNWLLSVTLSDSSVSNAGEFTTRYQGDRLANTNAGFFLLASYTRKLRERSTDGWSLIPAIHRKTDTRTEREVTVLCRIVKEGA